MGIAPYVGVGRAATGTRGGALTDWWSPYPGAMHSAPPRADQVSKENWHD